MIHLIWNLSLVKIHQKICKKCLRKNISKSLPFQTLCQKVIYRYIVIRGISDYRYRRMSTTDVITGEKKYMPKSIKVNTRKPQFFSCCTLTLPFQWQTNVELIYSVHEMHWHKRFFALHMKTRCIWQINTKSVGSNALCDCILCQY